MADPVDNLKRADEHIAALARARPKSDIAARVRAAELQRAHEIRDAAARKIVDENAAKRIVNGSTGHAKPVAVVATALSDGLTNELFKGLVPFLKEIIGDATTPLIARLDAIEKKRGLAPLAARLAGIEERMMTYEGVWSEMKAYSRGAFCTHQGSLWFAADGSIGVRPGAGSSSWKLAVKKGHAER